MIGLNLLPDVKKEFIKAQRTRNTVISMSIVAMMIAAGVTAAFALFVYVVQAALIDKTNRDIDDHQSSFQQQPEITKYLTVQNQLNALKELHSGTNKSLFSQLFDYLAKLNPAAPNSIALGSAKLVREGNSLTIQGTAGDFKSLDVFKNTLEKAKITFVVGEEPKEAALFQSVTLKNASLTDVDGKNVVAFEFMLVYTPEAFQPDAKNVQLTVPKETISDAKTNAPSEIFKGSAGGTQ